MRLHTIVMIFTMLVGTNAYALVPRTENLSLSFNQKQEILDVCHKPSKLHSSAEAALEYYLKGRMLNSSFYEDFIWLHPEYVDFASCVICESGRPNDPYWEAGFRLNCQYQGVIYTEETDGAESTIDSV